MDRNGKERHPWGRHPVALGCPTFARENCVCSKGSGVAARQSIVCSSLSAFQRAPGLSGGPHPTHAGTLPLETRAAASFGAHLGQSLARLEGPGRVSDLLHLVKMQDTLRNRWRTYLKSVRMTGVR